MENSSVVVVSGANRGIGYALVKTFSLKTPASHIYLACRDLSKGEIAAEIIGKEVGRNPGVLQLDITSTDSIQRAKNILATKHPKGIDVLVNNAGVLPKTRKSFSSDGDFVFDETSIQQTIHTNAFGTLNVCNAFLPIMSVKGRVVNLSSGFASIIYRHLTEQVQRRIAKCSSINDAISLMNDYLEMDPSSYRKKGWLSCSPNKELWPNFYLGDILPYGVSKLGISLLTMLFQQKIDNGGKHQSIISCCPGNVLTDMNPVGKLTPEQGADTPYFLATTKDLANLRGTFFAEGHVQDPFRYVPGW